MNGNVAGEVYSWKSRIEPSLAGFNCWEVDESNRGPQQMARQRCF